MQSWLEHLYFQASCRAESAAVLFGGSTICICTKALHIFHTSAYRHICVYHGLLFIAVFDNEGSDLSIHPQRVQFYIAAIELYDDRKIYIEPERLSFHAPPQKRLVLVSVVLFTSKPPTPNRRTAIRNQSLCLFLPSISTCLQCPVTTSILLTPCLSYQLPQPIIGTLVTIMES